MIYRVKQFIWAVNCNFKKINYEYVYRFLDEEEIRLFNKLKCSEKHHCIRVCNECLRIRENRQIDVDVKLLGKVALLHDIGKSEYKLNLIQKSFLVVLHNITKGKLKRFSSVKAIDIYYNHGIRGKEILNLKISKYNSEFLYAIENHHNYYIDNVVMKHNNILLEVLVEADNKN